VSNEAVNLESGGTLVPKGQGSGSSPSLLGRRVRVKLDTPEFFQLLARLPRVVTWALTKRQMTFVHDGTCYEIYE
jgi:hypothetical protein